MAGKNKYNKGDIVESSMRHVKNFWQRIKLREIRNRRIYQEFIGCSVSSVGAARSTVNAMHPNNVDNN